MASQPGPVMELLGRVAYEIHPMQPLFPTYLHLLISAIFPIYTAAHASLTRPSCAAPKKRKSQSSGHEDGDEEGTESQNIESLTPSDAILFPLLAGATLASLYFILTWLQDPAWLGWVLGLYFSQIGLFFATRFLKDIFSFLLSYSLPSTYSSGGALWKVDLKAKCFKSNRGEIEKSAFPGFLRHIPLPSFVSERIWTLRKTLKTKARFDFHLHQVVTGRNTVDILDLVSLIIASGLVYYHTFIFKPWYLTNFLGFSFCYGSLQFITPTTAWTGTLVLSALFFYDIYFVFFTPMMVTVATKVDIPIKLLFPRPSGCVYPVGAPEASEIMKEYLQCLAKNRTMAMLGLGDIVVPGMLLAFALRFDLYRFYLSQAKKLDESGAQAESKPVYANARGGWGERFWTGRRFWDKELQAKRFPKPYFYATIFGYIIGLMTTVLVMQIAQHAQPALLYLVPGVLLSLWGTALFRGETKLLFNYTEAPQDEAPKGDDKDKATPKSGQLSDKANGEDNVEQKEKSHTPGEQDKGKGSKDDWRLLHVSIVVPQDPDQDDESETRVTTDVAHQSSESIHEVAGKPDEPTTRRRDRAGEGQPPEKRARKE